MTGPSSTDGVGLAGSKRCNHMASTWRRRFALGGYDLARKSLLARMPPEHRRFLEGTCFVASLGDYFFCHAGVRPGVALKSQNPNDLLWIREDFLRHKGSWSQIIVHGHTPVPRPEVLPNRINIDTGAFASSILTALVLEGRERRFLSTERALEPENAR